MAHGISTGSGAHMLLTVPTRYHAYTADGSKYSLAAAADFLADAGFDGADLSLDQLEPDGDDVLRSVLYGFGNRAAARGLSLPLCHLPFYMPNPNDRIAMSRFSREIASGIRAAAMLLSHIGHGDKADKLMRAIVICSQEEKKLVMTGRAGGATAQEFTDYIIETLNTL